MNYTHKNISVDVTIKNPDWVEFTGDTTMTLPSLFVAELIENSCTFEEFFMGYQMEELKTELEEDEDRIIQHFKDLDEDVEVTHADAIIAVYEHALDNEETQYSFEVETENISWVIHDILHATHDAGGCTIYVASEIEKERIIESLEITKELFPQDMPDFSFLENLEEQYYARFKEHISLEEFKYPEGEYEEEYY